MFNNNHPKFEREYLPYLKLFPEEYLSSSLHYNCTLEEQGYFIAVLALAGKNRKERGTFSLEKGQPMPDNIIANALFLDLETHQRLWTIMVQQERLAQREDGVWYISNFDYYQRIYRRSRNAKDTAKQQAIEISQEERTRKYTRHNPDIAKDELHKIDEEKTKVINTDDAIDAIKNRATITDRKKQ